MTTSFLSLRERKKAETWTAIHEAAAGLALELGADETTVEAVARQVGISPRTFFNYFPTKEDAILGVCTPHLDDAVVEEIFDQEHLFESTTKLLYAAAQTAYAGGDPQCRDELTRRFPSLMIRRRELTMACEDLVQSALALRLAQIPEWAHGKAGHGVDELARMLTMAAGVPMRFAVTTQGGNQAWRLNDETLQHTIDLFQDLIRKVL